MHYPPVIGVAQEGTTMSPGTRPQSKTPAAGPDGKKSRQQPLRVHDAEGTASTTAPSITMPRANTELTELLAGDALLCVRRRPAPAAPLPNSTAQGSAESQPLAQSQPAPNADADLAAVIDAWPGLPRNVRAAILAMIRSLNADFRKGEAD
jgi:hypothetical protein